MNGKEFLVTAMLLQHKGSDEADFRTAISRAYYACFIELRDIAFNYCSEDARRRAHLKSERKIRHEDFLSSLRNSSMPEISRLGGDLQGLYGNRNEADYNMSISLNKINADDAIEEANFILADVGKLSPAEIGKALEEYCMLGATK